MSTDAPPPPSQVHGRQRSNTPSPPSPSSPHLPMPAGSLAAPFFLGPAAQHDAYAGGRCRRTAANTASSGSSCCCVDSDASSDTPTSSDSLRPPKQSRGKQSRKAQGTSKGKSKSKSNSKGKGKGKARAAKSEGGKPPALLSNRLPGVGDVMCATRSRSRSEPAACSSCIVLPPITPPAKSTLAASVCNEPDLVCPQH